MTRQPAPASPQGHVRSYYAATATPSPERRHLEGEHRCDVCIVGAGFTGLSAALELVARGYSVIVLEAERIGWGASGRNGGQMINGYSRDLDIIGRRYGPDVQRGLGEMALEGSRIIRERVATHDIACDLVDGGLVAAFTDKQMRELEDQELTWRRHGHSRMRMVDRGQVRKLVDSQRYVGGCVDELGGHLHPLNFVLGEARALEAAGGRIFENSRALSIETSPRPVVRLAAGAVRAHFILLCGNAYLGGAAPELTAKIMPVSSQVIATEPLGEARARALLPQNHCVEDMNFILDYYRLTADHRLLYGGGVVYGGQDPASIEGKILPNLRRTFPQLAGVKIDYAWSGAFALTLTRIPHVGRLSPNVYFSHGDSGHGVTTTQLLGRLLAEAVSAQAERFDLFAKLPYYPFPGGRTLRVPLTVLGSWYYAIRDRLGL